MDACAPVGSWLALKSPLARVCDAMDRGMKYLLPPPIPQRKSVCRFRVTLFLQIHDVTLALYHIARLLTLIESSYAIVLGHSSTCLSNGLSSREPALSLAAVDDNFSPPKC